MTVGDALQRFARGLATPSRVAATLVLALAAGNAAAAGGVPPGAMEAVFGAPLADGRYRWQRIAPSADTDVAIAAHWNGQAAIVDSLGWQETDPDHGSLVVEAMQLDARGTPVDCHACGALVSVFRLERRDGVWQLAASHVGVAEFGSFGRAGRIDFAEFGPDRHGFALLHIGGAQGQFSAGLLLFELTPDRVVPRLAAPLFVAGNNSGNCAESDPAVPPCYALISRWSFARDSAPREGLWPLQINYSGSRPDAPGPALRVRGTARYHLVGGVYVARGARNTLPEF